MRFEHWFFKLPLILRTLFRLERVEQKLDEELRYHLEMKTEQLISEGMSPEKAHYEALRAMDGVEVCKERCRDVRGLRWIREFLQDLCYAFRILAKSPGFTIVAVLMLALGIGANTAVVSVYDALVFQPLPFGRIDRLVEIPRDSINQSLLV